MKEIIEYFDQNPEVLFIIFLTITVLNIFGFYYCGKRAERLFPEISKQNIKYREKGASGYLRKNVFTRFGGASKVLDIVVTDTELWIKGIFPIFTYIGTKYDLSHRIKIKSIVKISESGKIIEIEFANNKKETSIVVLMLKNPGLFRSALNC